MLKIKTIESLHTLSELKDAYFANTSAPLDGMWHFGFVPMAKHVGFYLDGSLIGFCCINDDGYLMQFYVTQDKQAFAQQLFTLIAEQNSAVLGEVRGAFVSTAEPNYMSYCLDNSATFTVNALMYQYMPEFSNEQNEKFEMQLASTEQLKALVAFAASNIGAPQDWLNGYYGKLIERNELFGYSIDGKLLATGECRLFDQHQTDFADLGVVVAQSERGRGIAKQVLRFLIKHAASKGLKSICSTQSGNIGAQKAISRVGFIASHRIVQFEFSQANYRC
jgi:RimJ/RimL family protein N-acetyltransferase